MNRRLKYAIAGLTGAALLLSTATLVGYGRDPDGSRMQARKQAFGKPASDRLTPPTDAVDWRYFRLKDPKKVQIKVTTEPANANVQVQLTNAVGKQLVSTRTSKGTATINHSLESGLFYVSVSSNSAVRYTILFR